MGTVTFDDVADFGPGVLQPSIGIGGLDRFTSSPPYADVQPGQTVPGGNLYIGQHSGFRGCGAGKVSWKADGAMLAYNMRSLLGDQHDRPGPDLRAPGRRAAGRSEGQAVPSFRRSPVDHRSRRHGPARLPDDAGRPAWARSQRLSPSTTTPTATATPSAGPPPRHLHQPPRPQRRRPPRLQRRHTTPTATASPTPTATLRDAAQLGRLAQPPPRLPPAQRPRERYLPAAGAEELRGSADAEEARLGTKFDTLFAHRDRLPRLG